MDERRLLDGLMPALACKVCGSHKTALFHDKVWSMKNGSVRRCLNCDVAFINPIMTEEEERSFYRDYGKHVKKRLGGINYSPERLHRLSQNAARERYNYIGNLFLGSDSVIEVGSSTGAFLEILRGADTRRKLYAVEPDPQNRRYSMRFADKGCGDISQIKKRNSFDVICMFHVFEHIRKPMDFLSKCRAMLRRGGLLIIEVPSLEDPLISIYDCKAFKDFYFQPMHPYIYSIKTLRFIFQKSGFREEKVFYYQRYGLDNHIVWLSKGEPGGDEGLKKLFGPVSGYKEALQKAGKTDTLFYVARK